MVILFPHCQNDPTLVDSEFAGEWNAARINKFVTYYYDHYILTLVSTLGNADRSVQGLPITHEPTPLLLRGWMVPGEVFATLFEALRTKGYLLQTTPEAYDEAHYLPLAYAHTQGHSPRSAWITGDNADAAWELYKGFSDADAIIKDWVKSAKNRWRDGCFIPAHTTEEIFREIYRVFQEARGRLFNRGVVLRQFMPIVAHGYDLQGVPIVEETRLFFWRGDLVVTPDACTPGPMDQYDLWKQIARKFKSPFITIDVAQLIDGSWIVVEVGDGGVSGLPVGIDPILFYTNLQNILKGE